MPVRGGQRGRSIYTLSSGNWLWMSVKIGSGGGYARQSRGIGLNVSVVMDLS